MFSVDAWVGLCKLPGGVEKTSFEIEIIPRRGVGGGIMRVVPRVTCTVYIPDRLLITVVATKAATGQLTKNNTGTYIYHTWYILIRISDLWRCGVSFSPLHGRPSYIFHTCVET